MAEIDPLRLPEGTRQLFTAAEVDAAYRRMAGELDARLPGDGVVLLGVALGGLLPLARLAPLLPIDLEIDFCQVSRYGDALVGGEVKWLRRPGADLAGRTVVVIDDICDVGETLTHVSAYCREAGAMQVRTAVLLRKRLKRQSTVFEPDIVGLEMGDEFVFGCGMDYQGHWRHLPGIHVLSRGRGE